jgi:hypothetical protein
MAASNSTHAGIERCFCRVMGSVSLLLPFGSFDLLPLQSSSLAGELGRGTSLLRTFR